MKIAVRIFIDLSIVVLLVLFAFFLLYLHTGSWEMVGSGQGPGRCGLWDDRHRRSLRCVHRPPGHRPLEKAGVVGNWRRTSPAIP